MRPRSRPARSASPRARDRLAGVLEKFPQLGAPEHLGAVTHSSALEWPEEEPLALRRDGVA
jgi:dihydroxy-acid dehydratase